jgi:putative ABC transport system permease protein
MLCVIKMISKENIMYSLKNLWMRKSRSFLTLLSIFIGITTIFIFISFGWGLYDYVNDFATGSSADKFTVAGKGASAPGMSDIKMTEQDLETVQKTKGVIEATGYYMDVVEVEKDGIKKYVFVSAAEPKAMNLLMESFSTKIEKGRSISDGDSDKVALGYNYMLDNKIFPKGLNVNDKININGKKFKIVGFYGAIGNPQDDSNVYMTDEGYRKFSDEKDYSIIFGRSTIEEMEVVVDRIEKELRKARNEEEGKEEFTVVSFTEQIESFSSALNIIIGFIILIALISVIVSAVNTANTMVTSVLERIKEIGVIKSIGAKNSEIFNIFLFESSFLGFTAGVIGVLLGYLISDLGGKILTDLGWGFLSPHLSWHIFAAGIAFATIVGAISGVAPAINASKLKPVDALRYE